MVGAGSLGKYRLANTVDGRSQSHRMVSFLRHRTIGSHLSVMPSIHGTARRAAVDLPV